MGSSHGARQVALEQAGLVVVEYAEIAVVDLDRLRKFNG